MHQAVKWMIVFDAVWPVYVRASRLVQQVVGPQMLMRALCCSTSHIGSATTIKQEGGMQIVLLRLFPVHNQEYACGGAGKPDDLGCVTHNMERREKVKEAMRWTWKGYR